MVILHTAEVNAQRQWAGYLADRQEAVQVIRAVATGSAIGPVELQQAAPRVKAQILDAHAYKLGEPE